jgi:DNA-binding NtrC family response regulator
MEYTILIVEPDLLQGKEIVRTLVRAGYDAVVAPDADEALRQLYQVHPDAVIFSERLPLDEQSQLCDRIITMCDLPFIRLGDDGSPSLVIQQLDHSMTLQELPDVLNRLLLKEQEENRSFLHSDEVSLRSAPHPGPNH